MIRTWLQHRAGLGAAAEVIFLRGPDSLYLLVDSVFGPPHAGPSRVEVSRISIVTLDINATGISGVARSGRYFSGRAGSPGTYLGLELSWALLPIMIQLAFGADIL